MKWTPDAGSNFASVPVFLHQLCSRTCRNVSRAALSNVPVIHPSMPCLIIGMQVDHVPKQKTKMLNAFVLFCTAQAAQGDSRLGSAAGAAGSAQIYRDAEDAATIPVGNDLQVTR